MQFRRKGISTSPGNETVALKSFQRPLEYIWTTGSPPSSQLGSPPDQFLYVEAEPLDQVAVSHWSPGTEQPDVDGGEGDVFNQELLLLRVIHGNQMPSLGNGTVFQRLAKSLRWWG